jgi:hypothetical protein
MHSEPGDEVISNVITKSIEKVDHDDYPYLALAEASENRYHQTWDVDDIEQTVRLYNEAVSFRTRQGRYVSLITSKVGNSHLRDPHRICR